MRPHPGVKALTKRTQVWERWAMSEEEKNFSVNDRRSFNSDGSTREDRPEDGQDTAPEADAGKKDAGHEAGGEDERGRGFDSRNLPPVDFSGLILSLSHAAMMHLGQIPDPLSGQQQTDLGLARHTIDTIAMLKDKTSGNLSPDEQRLIDHALTELRLAYVHLSKENQK